jgi:hypothetical protein
MLLFRARPCPFATVQKKLRWRAGISILRVHLSRENNPTHRDGFLRLRSNQMKAKAAPAHPPNVVGSGVESKSDARYVQIAFSLSS